MERKNISSIDELRSLSDTIDSSGYESILLIFNPKIPDFWIRTAHIINPNKKLKYMIAIRPYIISPTYCAMMYEGFEQIAKDRLILNIVAGEVLNDEEAPQVYFDLDEDVSTRESRGEYVPKFLKDFFSLQLLSNKPHIVVGSGNPKLVKIAETYTDTSLSMYDDFKRLDLHNFKRKMVSLQLVLRNTQEEANKYVEYLQGQRPINYTFYGTKESLTKQLLALENEGITDVLISNIPGDEESNSLHEMIKNIVETGQKNNNPV